MNIASEIINGISFLNDPILLIKTVGYIGIFLIIFAETGLLFGFFLPGDSLLVTAGLLAALGHLSVQTLLISVSLAAIIGDTVGFFIGQKLGIILYKKDDSIFFKKAHLQLAHDFYLKHGGKTIIFARFIPIIRTFVPTIAGAAKMNFLKFSSFNIFGALIWVFTTILGGYYLGKIFGENLTNYIHYLIIIIIVISILPLIYKWFKMKKKV